MMKQFIQFQFEPRQVANLEMNVLLETFDPNTIAIPALRDFCGVVEIRFNHASDGPHPVLDMKLRQFLHTLAQRWGPHTNWRVAIARGWNQFLAGNNMQ